MGHRAAQDAVDFGVAVDVQIMTLKELKQCYFTGVNSDRTVPRDIAIVSAEVNKGEER